MYKTPSQEEHPQEPRLSYPRRTAPRRRQKRFYSDEHPEVPKVRRASLYLDTPADVSATSPVTRRKDTRRKKAVEEEAAPETEAVEAPHVPSTSPANKIMLARRRRHAVYEPPPTAYRRPHLRKRRKPQPALFGILPRLSRNRAIAFTTMLVVLFVLVLLPMTLNFLQSYRSSAQGPFLQSLMPGSGNNQAQTQPTADPHQIVLAPPNSDHPPPPVIATSAYLINADTGATLYAHNPFTHLPMLSTTKLMTALLAVEHGNLDQQ